eukprot:c30014_g1_i1 orf=372-653(-)
MVLSLNWVSKQMLDQLNEHAQKVEDAKLQVSKTWDMVATEIESRPRKLNDQRRDIADKQRQLERLRVEYDSLVLVKKEQDILIARLTHSTIPN